MARFSHRKNKMMSEINVVPYIDVMLVLLIIFMVTTPLLTKGIKVELPKTTTKPVKVPKLENFVVTVKQGSGGSIKLYLDDRAISRQALAKKLKKVLRIQPKTPILVQAKPHRVLIIDYADEDDVYFSHRFAYFTYSKPKWVMHEIEED